MRRLLAAVVAIVLGAVGAAVASRSAPWRSAATVFRNPVAPVRAGAGKDSLDSPDPWIFRARDRYFLTTSTGDSIGLRSSATLDGLASARVRRVWPAPRTLRAALPKKRCCQFWAPEFHRLHGPDGWRWYVYSAASDGNLVHHHIQVLESRRDDPRGPYHFRGMLRLGPDYEIDPTVFSRHGRAYVIYSDGVTFAPTHLALARLTNPWTVARRPVTISRPTYPWERRGLDINEGPEVLLHGAWLHVIYSASWCQLPDYALGRLTVPANAKLLDPRTWTHAKAPRPVFHSDPARRVFGTGHGSFFTSPDGRESWQVYHATDTPAFGACFANVRTTRAHRFTWNHDGTPNFGRPVSLSTDLAAPSGDPSFVRQFEDARVVARAGAQSTKIDDNHLVGGQGTRLTATRPGGALTYAISLPPAGRYRVLVRLATGPQQGRITLRLGGRRVVRRSAYSRAADYRELDLGRAALRAGRARIEVAPGSAGVTLDELRFVR